MHNDDNAAFASMQDETALVNSGPQGESQTRTRVLIRFCFSVAYTSRFFLSPWLNRCGLVATAALFLNTRVRAPRLPHPFSFEAALANLPPIPLVYGKLSPRVLIGGSSDLIHLA